MEDYLTATNQKQKVTQELIINNLRNKKQLWIVAGIFLLALAVRLIYLYQVSKSPTFLIPLVDSQAYDNAASQLAAQGKMDIQFFWQAFFYPMFLAIVYILADCSIIAAKLFQAVLGSAVCVLVYQLGLKIFDRRTAILAAVITALYGPLIFFDGELLATGWASLWALVLLLLFLRIQSKQDLWICLSFGICGGLSIITRATFLPFFTASCLWLAFSMRRSSINWTAVIFAEKKILIGFLIIVIPISIQCYRITGLFSPLPETGPINLYIGNNSERSDIMAIRPGGEWEEIKLMPIREGFRNRSQVQKFFMRRVIDYVVEQPLHFIKRMGRKTVHFFSSREIPNNTDIYANRIYSPLYSVLVWKTHNFGFPFGVLLPFAVIGMVRCWRKIPAIIILFMFLYPLSIILVFVTSRYRAPMIPIMTIIAAAGFWHLVTTVQAKRWLQVATLAVAVVAIPVFSSLPGPFAAEVVNYKAEKHHYVALYHIDHGNVNQAIDHLYQAIDLNPKYSEAYQSLGVSYVRQEKLEQASICFKKAIRLNPNYYSAHNNLGALLGRQGKSEEALKHFKKALELNPVSDTIHSNIGITLLELKRFDEAAEYLSKAVFYAEAFGNHALATQIKDNFGMYLSRMRK